MDGEKLIQVSLRIPPSALDSLSRLAEQLRLLAEAVNARPASAGQAAEAIREENTFFDPARFQALRQGRPAEMPEAAQSVSASAEAPLPEPEAAGGSAEAEPDAAADGTEDPGGEKPEDPAALSPPAEQEPPGEIPTARAPAETAPPNPPEAGWEAARPLPEAAGARAETREQGTQPAAVPREITGGAETPLGAGTVVHTDPALPWSRWSGVTEELVIPGPAPLTAEAVSLAFQRDGRRYDNGFPLY